MNRERLRQLLMDVFLLEDDAFTFDLTRDEVKTWDSLGAVALAMGVEDTFGCQMTPDETIGIRSIPELIALLETKGIHIEP